MKRLINDNWTFYKSGNQSEKRVVDLPHDAMLEEERSFSSKGGTNISWFMGGCYIYEKVIVFDESYRNKEVFLEFDGVYHNAKVYINDVEVVFRPYGYSTFNVEITKYLKIEKENYIKVVADNSDQPNSRWYSGSGIYRNVYLYVFEKAHIVLNGIKISTLSIAPIELLSSIETTSSGKLSVEVLDKERIIFSSEKDTSGEISFVIDLKGAKLWDLQNPYLYKLRVTFENDTEEISFGIRTIQADANNGFLINGKRVILKGCCIHHDNGLIGAVTNKFAEARKIDILKEVGYNAIRSAHNPCSKELLEVCDEKGMLVMDEYVDCWYIHKTKYDYASYCEKYYQIDLLDMVDKDYNHPCVIMYSTGNEVSESGQKRGIELNKKMVELLHSLDKTRPVTCGINLFWNFLSSIGLGVYSDKKADQNSESKRKKKSVGSEFFNDLAGKLGSGFMKWGATWIGCDRKTRQTYANLDVAGYNYGISRYKRDLKKYKKRLILGTETFCSDINVFYEMAKREKRIIGDFVWSGIDYLGEAGIGSWTYKEYAPDFNHNVGWITAGSGRVDITGKKNCEALFTQVVYDVEKIKMGVVPVKFYKEKHSPSSWKLSSAEESWSWDGCEKMQTIVEVYCKSSKVRLYVNDKLLGTKKSNGSCIFSFKVKYETGVLKAVGFDMENNEECSCVLISADKNTILTLESEKEYLEKDDLAYIRMKYTDSKGNIKPLARGNVVIDSISGGKLLGFGSGSSFYDASYLDATSDTYYGEALAIIKPFGNGEISISCSSPYGEAKLKVEVK